ncbi:DUF6882 domain-containing protein [Nocardioides aurantiacus]|uniref:DUF6882 domain-containing protein n=1 Tax=Nocardioides aurantiacus TaxID=86796 RepID=UPI00403F622D
MTGLDPALDLGTVLLQGHDMIGESIAVHDRRWGMSSATAWRLDQQAARVEWDLADGRTASAPAQVLGSFNAAAGTFVWAWDNPTLLDEVSETAWRVRDYGVAHEVFALTTSPLKLDLDQLRDLVALAFRVGGCTGLFHPKREHLTTYVVFGRVTLEPAAGSEEEPEQFEVQLP